ncbi:hypothetical protein ANN_27641 [Periplaneta americana]|uniref:Uncharacterized protein n=1 Tax=Periplaneta americana TaxID=6978 RepID=A0ABQ8RWC6_PERAM|nr:hypothetical protein ANN_27641 [Periplaneta americana]
MLNDKLGQFTEIPLQTLMLAEVFRSEASHFCKSVKLVEFLLDAEETEGIIKKMCSSVGSRPQFSRISRGLPHLLIPKSRLEIKKRYLWHDTFVMGCLEGHLETVKLLVEKGADVNTKDASKRTPLFCAIDGSHVNVVQFLIESGANVNAYDEQDQSPTLAAAQQYDECCQTKDKGIDVNIALMLMCNWFGQSPIFAAAEGGNVDVVSLLMDKGVDVNLWDKTAVKVPYSLLQKEALIDKGVDVNVCKKSGESPIFAAALGGNVDIVRPLMDKGSGESLIFAAARGGNVDIVRLLMDKGVDVNVCKKFRESPILPLHEETLMDEGVDVNVCNKSGESPIFTAAREGNVDIMRLLMDKGVDVNVCNESGESLIFDAAKEGNVDVVRLLMDKGADVNVYLTSLVKVQYWLLCSKIMWIL